MNGHFGYLDIILLAMLAGFIILRLRNILGRKTGHHGKPINKYFSKYNGNGECLNPQIILFLFAIQCSLFDLTTV